MDNINQLLVCPICHGNLSAVDDIARCNACGINFYKNKNIFSFICREMYQSDEEYRNAIQIIDFWGKGWEKRLAEPEHKYIFLLDQQGIKNYIEDNVNFQKDNDFLMEHEIDLRNIQGKTALNIGCGAGTESLILAYYGAHCIAMDITAQAAEAADRLIKIVETNGYGIQGDARFLPLESESVDLIYSSGVLHHSPDIRRSIEEIHRVLKPGGHAYIMLYAKWSLMFIQQRMIGILKGYITREKQNKYMSESGEGAWQTEARKNPYTETFTKAECAELFMNYKNIGIRKGGFSLSQIAKISKIIPSDRLEKFSKKYLHFLDPHLGACIFIDAEK
jgi:ubiquinone/menaquinone biosynthesis C-methylase UbiE